MRKQVYALLGEDSPQADAVVSVLPPAPDLALRTGEGPAPAPRRKPPQASVAADDQPGPIVVTNYGGGGAQADRPAQARSPPAAR